MTAPECLLPLKTLPFTESISREPWWHPVWKTLSSELFLSVPYSPQNTSGFPMYLHFCYRSTRIFTSELGASSAFDTKHTDMEKWRLRGTWRLNRNLHQGSSSSSSLPMLVFLENPGQQSWFCWSKETAKVSLLTWIYLILVFFSAGCRSFWITIWNIKDNWHPPHFEVIISGQIEP